MVRKDEVKYKYHRIRLGKEIEMIRPTTLNV